MTGDAPDGAKEEPNEVEAQRGAKTLKNPSQVNCLGFFFELSNNFLWFTP